MPKILDRLVTQLQSKGKPKDAAYAIAVSKLQKSGNLQKGTLRPTAKGIVQGNRTPATRAKIRASKRSGKPISMYTYNSRTNKAILKRKKK